MSKAIPLTKDQVAWVDDADHEWLNQWKWHAQWDTHTFYAVRAPTRPRLGKGLIRMHRVIMDARPDQVIDHIDGNGLNNQRGNLRLCTPTDNARNYHVKKKPKHGYRGIGKNQSNTWKAEIRLGNSGQKTYLGSFPTAEEAAHAYDKAARKHFGEFAITNFPD